MNSDNFTMKSENGFCISEVCVRVLKNKIEFESRKKLNCNWINQLDWFARDFSFSFHSISVNFGVQKKLRQTMSLRFRMIRLFIVIGLKSFRCTNQAIEKWWWWWTVLSMGPIPHIVVFQSLYIKYIKFINFRKNGDGHNDDESQLISQKFAFNPSRQWNNWDDDDEMERAHTLAHIQKKQIKIQNKFSESIRERENKHWYFYVIAGLVGGPEISIFHWRCCKLHVLFYTPHCCLTFSLPHFEFKVSFSPLSFNVYTSCQDNNYREKKREMCKTLFEKCTKCDQFVFKQHKRKPGE